MSWHAALSDDSYRCSWPAILDAVKFGRGEIEFVYVIAKSGLNINEFWELNDFGITVAESVHCYGQFEIYQLIEETLYLVMM